MLAREPGRAQMVYVHCAKCGALVARYRLRDYYHHGKGIESFLRSAGAVHGDSARDLLAEYEKIKGETLQGFEQAKELYGDLWLGFPESDLQRWLDAAGFKKIEISVVAREEQPPHFQTILASTEAPRSGK